VLLTLPQNAGYVTALAVAGTVARGGFQASAEATGKTESR
jgi:hypothetical protein